MEHEGNRFVRDGDWKLVGLNTKPTVWELFNITTDPTEMNNLAAQEPARVKEMAAAHQQWLARCSAEFKSQQDKKTKPAPGEAGTPKSEE